MAGRQATLRLRGRSYENAQGRRLVILACTMAGILLFLSLQHRGSGKDKSPRDTHLDWTVSRAVVVKKDPFVESVKGVGNVDAGDVEEKVDAIRVEEKEEVREEEKEEVREEEKEEREEKEEKEEEREEKEEKEGGDGKERMEEPEDKDDDGNDGIEKEDGHFEGLALGDEVTSNEDEAAEEEAGDDRILQVAPKSFPVSLVGNRRPITLAL
jgi:hypothetical protein